MAILIGCDPGKLGGITIMQTSPDNKVRLLDIKMMPGTEMDIKNVFLDCLPKNAGWVAPKDGITEKELEWESCSDIPVVIEQCAPRITDSQVLVFQESIKCIIETQHAFPGMGAGAQWTFAQHYGFLRGVLVSLGIPFREVSPQSWMGFFGFRREKNENKKKHKLRILQKAQNLYPHSSVVLQTADSLMLCEYLRLTDNRG